MNTKAREWAIKAHREVNHKYDGQPYTVHLELVHNFGMKYLYLIPEVDRQDVHDAWWKHDTIEDCRKTPNDVKAASNYKVARIVYAVTNEKGWERKDRANNKYYRGIRNEEYADFVKLIDRLANMTYSKSKGSGMFKKYCAENPHFISKLFPKYSFRGLKNYLKYGNHIGLYKPMVDELIELTK